MKIVVTGRAQDVFEVARVARKKGLTVATASRQEWTRETAAEALREWSVMNGRTPTFNSWSPCPSGCPSRRTLQGLFGSWRVALEAAGLPAPGPGQYARAKAPAPRRTRRARTSP